MDTIGSGAGDLTHRLPVDGNDEVAQISASFNSFVEKIGEVLLKVRMAVDSMASATAEISGTATHPAPTETSAGSLEKPRRR